MDDYLLVAVLGLFLLCFLAVILWLVREMRAIKYAGLSEAGIKERDAIRAETEMALAEAKTIFDDDKPDKGKRMMGLAFKYPRASKYLWKELKGLFTKLNEMGLLTEGFKI